MSCGNIGTVESAIIEIFHANSPFYGVLARVTDLLTPHVTSAIPFSACEMHYRLIVFYT
jgi:hypothetical protein